MAFSRPRTPQPPSQTGLRTPPDQEMSDQITNPSPRPMLPTSTADFALPSGSAPTSPAMSSMALDDVPMATSPYASPVASAAWTFASAYGYSTSASGPVPASTYPLLRKLRRPSLLGLGVGPLNGFGPNGNASRMNSPLATSFTSSSPFTFESPPANSKNASKQLIAQVEEEEEYTPVLLYEGSGRTEERDPETGPSSSTSSLNKKIGPRISRSMSPSTPPPRRTQLEGVGGEEGGSSSKLLPSRAPTLRRSSSSNSIGYASTSNAAASKPQPIPTVGPSGIQLQKSRPSIPRLRNIITESNPADIEVKSEARFQRFMASHAEIPTPFKSYPRTPRSRHGSANGTMMGTAGGLRPMAWPGERGRFPEEACADDEDLEHDSGSSDGGGDTGPEDCIGPGGAPMSLTEESSLASFTGALGMHRGSSGSLGGMMDSPAGMDMDVTMAGSWCGSPPVSVAGGSGMNTSGGGTPNQWRHTPPPTASGIGARLGKRKFNDDRNEAYPNAKRRAVSPAIVLSPYHSHPSLASPITMNRPLPASATSSPILRPVVRLSGHYASAAAAGPSMGPGFGASNGTHAASRAEEKNISGAGDGVGSLRL